MRKLMILSALMLTACGTVHTEVPVKTVEVKVPVAIPCPDNRLPKPKYPDTSENVANVPSGDIGSLVKLLLEGRELRIQREREDDAQISSCSLSSPQTLNDLQQLGQSNKLAH